MLLITLLLLFSYDVQVAAAASAAERRDDSRAHSAGDSRRFFGGRRFPVVPEVRVRVHGRLWRAAHAARVGVLVGRGKHAHGRCGRPSRGHRQGRRSVRGRRVRAGRLRRRTGRQRVRSVADQRLERRQQQEQWRRQKDGTGGRCRRTLRKIDRDGDPRDWLQFQEKGSVYYHGRSVR